MLLRVAVAMTAASDEANLQRKYPIIYWGIFLIGAVR